MTKEEFVALQPHHQQSGKSLKKFLQEVGVCYSKYNYWNKKFKEEDQPHELAPIMFTEPRGYNSMPQRQEFTCDVPSGATFLFPNGLRAHFGSGTETMLMSLLERSLSDHVLP
ncbi:MAG: hypothetical protein KBT39_03930 [Bacteroidales bacterium]|nr:hypothetical protein [Bacteroidales bacterium]